jgi:hypothetical protein
MGCEERRGRGSVEENKEKGGMLIGGGGSEIRE